MTRECSGSYGGIDGMTVDQDSRVDDEGGGTFPWRMVLLIVLMGIGLWILFGDEQLCTPDQRTCYVIWVLYTTIGTMGILILRAGYIWLKYRSPQFVGNNIHASITGRRPVSAGKWFLIKLGGIDCGVTVDGTEGTAIFPQEAYNRLGSQVAVPSRFTKRSLDQLDLIVQHKLVESGFPKPYWYGDIDETQFHMKADEIGNVLTKAQRDKLDKLTEEVGSLKKFNPAQLHLLLLDTTELVSKYKKERETLMGDAESVVAFGSRIHDKATHIKGVRGMLPSRKPPEER